MTPTTWRTDWILERFEEAWGSHGPRIWLPTMIADGVDGILVVSHNPMVDIQEGLLVMLSAMVMTGGYVQGIVYANTVELVEDEIDAEQTVVTDPEEDLRRLLIIECTRERALSSRAYPLRDDPRGMPAVLRDAVFDIPSDDLAGYVEPILAAWDHSEMSDGAPVALSSMPLAMEVLYGSTVFATYVPYDEETMRSVFEGVKEHDDE